MKHLIVVFSFLFAINANAQEPANIFGTGRGNLKLTSGVFTKTRPNGNLIAALPAYFTKDSIDKYINNYNDTTSKFAPACVDSLWKSGNIVKHRNWNCDIQEFTLDSANLSGCAGGRVYHKTTLADTSMLTPSPVCGDILTITLDTCKEYLYIRGTAPNKWNYVGAYLTNANCADPLPCKDSLWRVNDKVYHRNVNCMTQIVLLGKDTFTNNFTISGDTFRIFRNDGTIYTQIYSPGAGVLDSLVTTTANATNYKFTIGPNRLVSSIEFVAGDKIKFEDGVTGKFGTMKISSDAKDTLRTTTANSSTFTVTHSPARTTDFTLKAGSGVKFDSPSVGSGSAHGEITISADTSSTFFDGLANQLITAGTTGANNANVSLTPQTGTSKVNLVGAGINTVSASTGINGTITITGTEVDGDASNELQTYAHSGTGGYTNTLSRGGGTFSLIAGTNMTISRSGGDVTLNATTQTPTITTQAPISGSGTFVDPIRLEACSNWWSSLTPAADNIGGYFLFVDGLGCLRLKNCSCTGDNASLNMKSNDMYAGGNVLESKFNDQQATINKQAKLIEELTARLDRLDRLQASK